MNWLRDFFYRWKAWGDAWLGTWFDPQPIHEIDNLDTPCGMRKIND